MNLQARKRQMKTKNAGMIKHKQSEREKKVKIERKEREKREKKIEKRECANTHCKSSETRLSAPISIETKFLVRQKWYFGKL